MGADEPLTADVLASKSFAIQIDGRAVSARVSPQSFYDPKSERMRA